MRWWKPGIRNSISAFLGSEPRCASPESLEPVRQAMLNALGENGARMNPQLSRRLSYLPDAQGLWYARAEVVSVLSHLYGEAKAVEMVQRLSPAFKGLLPKSIMDSCRLRR